MRKRYFLFTLLALNFTAFSEEVLRLDKVQFTATKTERQEKETSASTSTITKDEIKFERMLNLSEPLQEVSGVNAESKNNGYDVRLIIRGGGLNAPYGIRQINVLLDGVPITDPDGLTRLDFVNPQLVEQIEIVKGPNSTLYGANAIGGVVNFITKPVWDIKGGKVKLGAGRYNTQLYNFLYGSNIKGKLFYYVDLTRQSSDSFRQWNEFKSNRASFKVGYLIDDNSSIESFFSYTKSDLQLPGAVTKKQFDTNPYIQYKENKWLRNGRYSEIYFWNVKYNNQITDSFTLRPIFYFQKWSHYHPVTGVINDGGAKVYGTDFMTEFKHNFGSIKADLVSGFQIQYDDYDADKFEYADIKREGQIFYTLTDRKGKIVETNNNKIIKYGFYAQETVRPTEKFIIDVGLRWDTVKFDLNNITYEDTSQVYTRGIYTPLAKPSIFDKNKTFISWSPKIGLVYKVNNIVNLFTSYSTGFQTPQWSQLTINPDLKNTKASQYEIGFKSSDRDNFFLNGTLFYIKSKDEIVRTIQDNQTYFSNAGKVSKKGFELDGRFKVLDDEYGKIYLGGAYTYSDFIYKTYYETIGRVTLDRSNNRMEYIPKHKYTLYMYYFHPSGLRAKVDTNTWGEYYIDAANSEKYKGYEFLTNLSVNYEKKNFEVGFSIYNLFDKKYSVETTKSWSTPTTGTAYFVPGSPRNYFVYGSLKF